MTARERRFAGTVIAISCAGEVLTPALDPGPAALGSEVVDEIVLQELGLRVDLAERFRIAVPPLPEKEPLGAQLLRDHDFASFQSSPTPMSTASAGSSG